MLLGMLSSSAKLEADLNLHAPFAFLLVVADAPIAGLVGPTGALPDRRHAPGCCSSTAAAGIAAAIVPCMALQTSHTLYLLRHLANF